MFSKFIVYYPYRSYLFILHLTCNNTSNAYFKAPLISRPLYFAYTNHCAMEFKALCAQTRKVPITYVMSVRLSTCINAALSGRIGVKFNTWFL
jgi:hypothetical protein